MTDDPLEAACTAALRLLARREHGRLELERKLTARGIPPDIASAALDRLAQAGLQSDRRYAEGYLRTRLQRGCGRQRIVAELRSRGIGDADIDAALSADPIDWTAHAREACRRRFGEGGVDYVKARRFLEYRGFATAEIRAVLEGTGDEDER